MHGRVKIKTTKEQAEEKKREQQKKFIAFQAAQKTVFEKRKNAELDDEALQTTRQMLNENPDFYTLWNFRKEILLHVTKDMSVEERRKTFAEELSLTESCLYVNPKSYGTWHQRCWVLRTMPEPDWQRELKLCNLYLQKDERNFHCWDYRRYIVQNACVPPEDELEFTMEKINNNFSNYSSWHYRSKLLPLVYPNPDARGLLREDKYLEELELVQNAAFTDPNDQSAWFYHRWLLGRGKKPLGIRTLYVNRTAGCVVISLTQEIPVAGRDVCFRIVFDGTELVDAKWEASDSKLFSTSVWILQLPVETKDVITNVEVTIESDKVLDSLSLTIDPDVLQNCIHKERSSDFRSFFLIEMF